MEGLGLPRGGSPAVVALIALAVAGLGAWVSWKRARGRRTDMAWGRRPGQETDGAPPHGILSLEELQRLDKGLPSGAGVLRAKLLEHSRNELVDILLVCSYVGLRNVLVEVLPMLKADKARPPGDAVETRQGRSSSATNAFLIAARQGQLDIVETLLSMDCVDVNARNSHGNSALILAAFAGHLAIVKLLVSRAVDPNIVNRFQATALACACERGFVEIVDVLLQRGDVNPSVSNQLALRKALHFKHHGIVLRVLQASALAVLPPPAPPLAIDDHLLAELHATAVDSARQCAGLMRSDWLAPLPVHLRAYVVSMAFGNSVILVGPARSCMWRISKVLLDVCGPVGHA